MTDFIFLINLCLATQSNWTKEHLEHLTFTSKIHIFMLKMIGKYDLLNSIYGKETLMSITAITAEPATTTEKSEAE